MNLTERLDVLISESAGHKGPFFYRLLDLTRELAERLEQEVGSLKDELLDAHVEADLRDG